MDSTNRWLLEQAETGAAEGMVAVADHQSAGRGRLSRSWEAPPGSSLLVSVLLRPSGLDPSRWHLVTSAAGLAARAAVEAAAGFTPDLKWPNDLLAGGAKLAGVLAEARSGALVVGLGCNIAWAPPGAACCEAVAGRPVERAELLGALLESLEGWYGRWDDVAVAYRAACSTVGQAVRVERPGGDLVGVAEGVDDDGRLVVRPPGRPPETVAVGDVVHLRVGSGR